MAFDAGAITAKMQLDASDWNKAVQTVQANVRKMTDRARELGQEFAASGQRLSRFGNQLLVTGSLAIAPLALAVRSLSKENATMRLKLEEVREAMARVRVEVAGYLMPWIDRLRQAVDALVAIWNRAPVALKQFSIDALVVVGVASILGGALLKLVGSFQLLIGAALKAAAALFAFTLSHPVLAAFAALAAGLALLVRTMLQTEEGARQLKTTLNTLAAGFVVVAQAIATAVLHAANAILKTVEVIAELSTKIPGVGQFTQDFTDRVKALRAEVAELAVGSSVALRQSLNDLQIALYGGGTAAQDLVNNLRATADQMLSMTGIDVQGWINQIVEKLNQVPDQIQNIASRTQQFFDGVKLGLKDTAKDLSDWGAAGQQLAERTATAMQSAMSDLFFRVMKGEFHSLKEVAVDFGNTLLRILSDIFAQKFIGAIAGLLGGVPINPISGKPVVGMGLVGGYQEGTERVPSTGLYRLHEGEKVVPRYDATGSGDGLAVEIVNVITPEAVALAMSGKEGKRVIVNVMNEDSIRNGIVRREVVRR